MGTGGQDGKVQAVITCQGDIDDPDFPERCQQLFDRLSKVVESDGLDVTKCEPWNSVKVTFNIPKDAAEKLAKLAEGGDEVLRELGILSLQMEGGKIISMTMVQDDSDSDDERPNNASEPRPSTSKAGAQKPKISPKEDMAVTVKQEAEEVSSPFLGRPSISGSSSNPLGGLPFPLMQAAAAQQSAVSAGGPRDTPSAQTVTTGGAGLGVQMQAAAMFMKNLPSSAASILSPADQSVLQSYSGVLGVAGAGKETTLLASLISSRLPGTQIDKCGSSGVSSLLGHSLKDNDEPANKKARKGPESGVSVSPKSKLDSGASSNAASLYPFNKLIPGDRGFSLHPVSSVAATVSSLRTIPGSQVSSSINNPESQSRTSPVGSALRLASLPGVSLTAVNSRNTQPPVSSHSQQKLSRASLMPPPSSAVTLSPVPRTSPVGPSGTGGQTGPISQPGPLTNPAELRCIETGDKSVKPSSPTPVLRGGGVDISPSKQSLNTKNRPLLINPVTGQIEAGSAESSSEGENENSALTGAPVNDAPDDALEDRLRRTKHKSGSQSPGNPTSEQPLKLKLNLSSIPNNSSKNLVTPRNDTIRNNVLIKASEEPKVPKIKIRLGKDQKVVKLDNDAGENHDGNDLEDMVLERSLSPIQNDLKSKLKNKPLGSKSPLEDPKDNLFNSNFLPGHPGDKLANHTSVESDAGRKLGRKITKKEKKPDRLAVWTESLAKHGKREESKDKDDNMRKDSKNKTWPEVLESRLFSSTSLTNSNSIPTNSSSGVQSFKKSEVVLVNQQTDKGGEHDKPGSREGGPESPHLNWPGPGRDPQEPGPGPGGNQLAPLDQEDKSGKEAGHEDETVVPAPITNSRLSVLDILEARPPTGGELPSSPGPQNGRDTGQQGEDSGIESMDSRSEKSPNQGESPFHAALSENGTDIPGLGHLPTYSSSMGSSGKLSPPVSENGSTDSALTSNTPPDKSPSEGLTVSSVPNPPVQINSSICSEHSSASSASNTKLESEPLANKINHDASDVSHKDEVTNPPLLEKDVSLKSAIIDNIGASSVENCIEESNSLSDPKNCLAGQVTGLPDPEKSKLPCCDSKSEPASEDSNRNNSILDNSKTIVDFSQSDAALTNQMISKLPTPHHNVSNDEPKTDLVEPIENLNEELESKSEEVLLRSCDGTDDPKISPPKESGSAKPIEITNCMHDYTTYKDINNISNKSNEDQSSSPPSLMNKLLAKRLSEESDTSTKSQVESLPGLVKISGGDVDQPIPTMQQAPVSTVHLNAPFLGAAGIQVRSALQVPPGARMVPVKLVTVPGAGGNVRMLRVSPVKTGISGTDVKVSSLGPSGLPPRTVVIKSSILKAVTTQGFLENASLGTASFVRYPMPTSLATNGPVNCDIPSPLVTPEQQPSQPAQVSQSSIAHQPISTSSGGQGISLLKKSHVNLTPVESNSLVEPCSQTNTAPVTFEKRASVEDRKSTSPEGDVPTASPLSVDVTTRLTDADKMPSPARKSTLKTSGRMNGGDASDLSLPSSPKPERKSKKSSGESSRSDSSDCESLLRPLLAKDDTPSPPSPLPNLDSPSTLTLPLVNPRKRSRRDTGSSAASDKSDLSALSEPSGKKIKDEIMNMKQTSVSPVKTRSLSADKNNPPDKEESTVTNNITDDEKELDVEDFNDNMDDRAESDKESFDDRNEEDNGLLEDINSLKKSIKAPSEKGKGRPAKFPHKKTSPKKPGVLLKKKGGIKSLAEDLTTDDKAEMNNGDSAEAETTQELSTDMENKVDVTSAIGNNTGGMNLATAKADQTRRVSTRSKKPEENSGASKRR